MILVLVSCGCLFLGVWLWIKSVEFTVDAAPIGGMMVATAIGLWIASIFIFGVQVGTMIS